jgi:hypothetical protein
MGDLPPAANPRAAKASHMNPRYCKGTTNTGSRWNLKGQVKSIYRKQNASGKMHWPHQTAQPDFHGKTKTH